LSRNSSPLLSSPLLSAKLDLLQEPKFFATKCSKKSETKTEVRRVRSTLRDSTTYIRLVVPLSMRMEFFVHIRYVGVNRSVFHVLQNLLIRPTQRNLC
jgi:hypothetical protein